VVLVDDHELAREGMKSVLAQEKDIEVVGEAVDSFDAISVIEECRPDVAVVDIRLRRGSGLDVVKACRETAHSTKFLVISAYDDHHYVKSMVRLGVRGYLVKSASTQEIVTSIRDVAEGDLVFPRAVADKVLELLASDDRPARRKVGGSLLTGREYEVLEHIGEGLTNREIARVLGISMKTVEAHVRHLLLKLRVTSRTQAVVLMMRGQPAS
jgi:NarL family two-component system response regulator LiaR